MFLLSGNPVRANAGARAFVANADDDDVVAAAAGGRAVQLRGPSKTGRIERSALSTPLVFLSPIPRACEGRADISATRWRRLGGGWLPSPVRFSGMMMLLLLRPAAARFSYRGAA